MPSWWRSAAFLTLCGTGAQTCAPTWSLAPGALGGTPSFACSRWRAHAVHALHISLLPEDVLGGGTQDWARVKRIILTGRSR